MKIDNKLLKATQSMRFIQAAQITGTEAYRTYHGLHPFYPTHNEITKKLLASYDPDQHLVGVKAVSTGLKDLYGGTKQYPREGIVIEPGFNGMANCGHGLHSSFMHSVDSMCSTLSRKREQEALFQLVLNPANQTVIVDGNKFKTGMYQVVHTGRFNDIFIAMWDIFPNLRGQRSPVSN